MPDVLDQKHGGHAAPAQLALKPVTANQPFLELFA
jgi:hypothetical protein